MLDLVGSGCPLNKPLLLGAAPSARATPKQKKKSWTRKPWRPPESITPIDQHVQMESSGMSEAPPLWYIGHHDTGRVDPVGEHVLHRAQDANVSLLQLLSRSR